MVNQLPAVWHFISLAPSGLPYCWCNGVLNFHTAPLLAFAKLPGVIKFTVAIATLQLYPCYSSAACASDKQLITEEYNAAIFKAYLKIKQTDFSVFFFFYIPLLRSGWKYVYKHCSETHLDPRVSYCLILLMKWTFFGTLGPGEPETFLSLMKTPL